MTGNNCVIWDTPAVVRDDAGGDRNLVRSERAGGSYYVVGSAQAIMKSDLFQNDDDVRLKLTSWLVEQRSLGVEVPEVTSNTLRDMETRDLLSVTERQERLLRFLAKLTRRLGQKIDLSDDAVQRQALAHTESLEQREVQFLRESLANARLVTKGVSGMNLTTVVNAEGYDFLASSDRGARSDQAFVAMWFNLSMQEAYDEGIHKGVEDAGYSPLRIDGKEHNNKIDDEIIAEIKRSRFVVVDFTQAEDNARGGVYYEAGFAHGLDIPVIFTCRADAIEYVHFDTRQYNHIVWETPEDLREQLEKRICAVIGDGPNREH